MAEKKEPRLERTSDRMIAGVCGGLGKYTELDPIVFRILFVLLAFVDGLGLVLYIMLWVLIPESKYAQTKRKQAKRARTKKRAQTRQLLGIGVILIGILALLNALFPLTVFDWRIVWSLIILALGAWVIAKGRRH